MSSVRQVRDTPHGAVEDARANFVENNRLRINKGDNSGRDLTREALHALNARLIDAQEHERKRIARELHDGINQKLAVLVLEMGCLARQVQEKDGEAAGRLFEIRDQTAALSRDVRRVSHQLHPAVLEHMGLVGAIRNTCREHGEATDITPAFALIGNLGRIEADLALALFRITQEALHNVARHANATQIEVSLERTRTDLILRIEDNGVGMRPQRRRSLGLGLVSMDERSRQVGGCFELSSPRGGGVTITVRVPMRGR